jgi:hypothetical protein
MDLAPNLSWFLLGVGLAYIWPRQAPCDASERRARMIALDVPFIISLPAISMTDDLVAAQNTSEVGCSLRLDREFACPHTISPAVASLPQSIFAGLSFGHLL